MSSFGRFSLLAAFLVTVACSPTPQTAPIRPSPAPKPGERKPVSTKRALLFGDSLATSFGVSKEKSKIASCLAGVTGQPSLVKAQNGSTSREVLTQIQDAKDEKASLVFLSVGGNDVIQNIYSGNFPEEETFRNFKKIRQLLEDRATPVIFLMLNPPYKGSERLPQLANLAHDANWVVVDGMNGLWNQSQYMSDEIHPNDAGYQLICDRIRTALQKAGVSDLDEVVALSSDNG